MCQSIFMELARTEAKFFGVANLPLVEIPHHPSGGARPGEHRADAEGAVESVREKSSDLRAVGVDEAFLARGREILVRLGEALRRRDEERARTPETTLDLNWAKGILYTRARYVARIARVEWRNTPAKAARYAYGPLRRRAPGVRLVGA